MDSNHRYPAKFFWLPRRPPIHLPQYKPALSRQGPMVRIHLPPAGRQPRPLAGEQQPALFSPAARWSTGSRTGANWPAPGSPCGWSAASVLDRNIGSSRAGWLRPGRATVQGERVERRVAAIRHVPDGRGPRCRDRIFLRRHLDETKLALSRPGIQGMSVNKKASPSCRPCRGVALSIWWAKRAEFPPSTRRWRRWACCRCLPPIPDLLPWRRAMAPAS
jgi:hypothetical protein